MGQFDSSGVLSRANRAAIEMRVAELRTVWFVGADSVGSSVVGLLHELQISPVFLRSYSDLRHAVSRSIDRLIVAVIDVDVFGDLGGWFDTTLDLRSEIPDLTIILTSSAFRYEDLSCERLPICDASILQGFTGPKLIEAITTGIDNNSEWQRRAMAAQRIRLAAIQVQNQGRSVPSSTGV